MNNARPKPVVLIILDGFGIAAPSKANAFSLARMPNLDSYIANYPVFNLQASGDSVGLSWGEMGNSEVGHLSLGAGKILFQNLPRITKAISDGSFYNNQAFINACKFANENNGNLHLMGLVSQGGVHSYNEHLYALVELAEAQRVKRVYVHAFLDGRDTSYNSGKEYIDKLQKKLTQVGLGEIATISGRYWAMDRDNNWDRIAKAYLAMTEGKSEKKFEDPIQAIDESYKAEIFDEEFVPTVITKNNRAIAKIKEGDSLIFFNFRADRARQLTKAFVLPGFAKFNRSSYLKNLNFVAMTEYEKELPVEVAFPQEVVKKPLAKVIAEADLKQLHIAETEKYAHVTFFFNGGKEKKFDGEERIIIPSPLVSSYDQKPEMSAQVVASRILKEIEADKFDFIVVNFANPDMVGHTGNLNAAAQAIEILDDLTGQIVNKAVSKGGLVFITSDHGNAEEMVNLQTGEIIKEHSSNPVPFFIISHDFKGKVAVGSSGKDLSQITPIGVLADVAPTVLKVMGLKRPEEMTGRSLI